LIDHLQGLRVEVERVRAAVGDLDAAVPACPDWRVLDLVLHLGTVHRRFRRVADEGWMQRPPEPDVDDRPAADDDRVVAWADQQADLLLDALERLDPEAPRWNFSLGPQLGAFIPRRMHHETPYTDGISRARRGPWGRSTTTSRRTASASTWRCTCRGLAGGWVRRRWCIR
jgi:hypothetical protein